eukprot:gene8063-10923_t
MKSAILSFLLIFNLCSFSLSFFDLFKSSSSPSSSLLNDPSLMAGAAGSAKQEKIDISRGVHPIQKSKYDQLLAKEFKCDDGKKLLAWSSINDDFCDCLDKSDEPGTNACSDNKFTCINQGYKVLIISSSRVDDFVCDCCDGSDEKAAVKCPNICNQAAEKERALIEKKSNAFRIGHAIRNDWENKSLTERTQAVSAANNIEDASHQLKMNIQQIEEEISEIENQLFKETEGIRSQIELAVNGLLSIRSMGEEQVAQFLSNLVNLADLNENDIISILNSDLHIVGTKDKYEISNDEQNKASKSPEYEDDEYEEHSEQGQEEDEKPNNDPPLDEICPLIKHSGNSKLKPLCITTNVHDTTINFLSKLLYHEQLFDEIMLLHGYVDIHGHYEGSPEFVKNHKLQEAQANEKSCPSIFATIPEKCELSNLFQNQIYPMIDTLMKSSDYNSEHQSKIEKLNHNREYNQNILNGYSDILSKGKSAESDLEKFKDSLAFLSIKDNCYEVVDGKFSYSVCMLDKVTQKEQSGDYNQVTLGNYDSIELKENGDYIMHFTNGQYCHAFGARKADILLQCGAENKVKAASEPSTCFYSIIMESPVACTKEFAMTNGIPF